jgi:hypothetical protein
MNSRLFMGAGDPCNSPVFLKRFRRKTVKELYRYGITCFIAKLVGFAVTQIPTELTKVCFTQG